MGYESLQKNSLQTLRPCCPSLKEKKNLHTSYGHQAGLPSVRKLGKQVTSTPAPGPREEAEPESLWLSLVCRQALPERQPEVCRLNLVLLWCGGNMRRLQSHQSGPSNPVCTGKAGQGGTQPGHALGAEAGEGAHSSAPDPGSLLSWPALTRGPF